MMNLYSASDTSNGHTDKTGGLISNANEMFWTCLLSTIIALEMVYSSILHLRSPMPSQPLTITTVRQQSPRY